MSLEIRELEPADLEALVEFWPKAAEAAKEVAPLELERLRAMQRLHPTLSLVARDGGQIVGAILIDEISTGGRMIYRLAVAEPFRDGELPRELVDKALWKLFHQRVHACRLQVLDESGGLPLWQGSRWKDLGISQADKDGVGASKDPAAQPSGSADTQHDATDPPAASAA
ncbi:MAG: GNAT family N-acetyltransferase [Phycisphaeraceae bacterium]|nr:GNAT family N-acetyltransferase [Phycisphaeraceae bacterium]